MGQTRKTRSLQVYLVQFYWKMATQPVVVFGGAGVVPPKSDRLTLSERSILLSDTRSQVKTMTNEAVGGWETSNRQMRSRL